MNLYSKLISLQRQVKDVSRDDNFDGFGNPEVIRENILRNAGGAECRTTLDKTLILVTKYGSMITMNVDGDRVWVEGRHSGTEEYDGEDSGCYTFWMNKKSMIAMRALFTRIPQVSHAKMNSLIKDH